MKGGGEPERVIGGEEKVLQRVTALTWEKLRSWRSSAIGSAFLFKALGYSFLQPPVASSLVLKFNI